MEQRRKHPQEILNDLRCFEPNRLQSCHGNVGNIRGRPINCQLFQAEKVDFQELSTQLQEMTLCSLGPNDCIYVMNGRVVTTGWLAAQLKHQVEVTKMGEMRQETLLDDVPKKCFCEKRRLGPSNYIVFHINSISAIETLVL